MSASTLTAFLPIAEGSDATPGLFNSRFQTLQDNIVSVNSVVLGPSVLSGSTWASIGLFANSSNSDYIRFNDTSNQRSTYRLGSAAGGTADGLNLWDESGNTMLVSFSKQSIRFFQNVVGPVFDIGGALASTLNAGTFGSGSDSKESRIAAAIVAAANQGIARVYIPANMYPYSASSVSFIDTIQMIREGGDAADWDVIAYGAALNGTQDDTAAFRNTITALPDRGGVVTVPQGTPRLTASLSTAIQTKRSVTLRAKGTFGSAGVSSPPVRWPTVLNIAELNNYVFSHSGSTLENFRIEGMAFDGASGGGPASRTTICPGIIEAPTGTQLNFGTLQDVGIFNFNYSHVSGANGGSKRALIDLDIGIVFNMARVFIGNIPSGRMIFTDNGSTTFFADHCYFTNGQEIFYHRKTSAVVYDSCIFESVGVVGAAYLSDVRLLNPYFENIGANGAAGPGSGLAARNHGIGGGVGTLLAGPITTAIQQLYGHVAIYEPLLQALASGGSSKAWIEAIGVSSANGAGGTLVFRGARKNDAAATDSLFSSTMSFNAQERGTQFNVILEDGWGPTPTGAVFIKSGDARMVTSGRATIAMHDQLTAQKADIRRGNYILNSEDTIDSFTSAPGGLVYPRSDVWMQGDQIIFPSPVSGNYMGLVCTSQGTSNASWGYFGHIDATVNSPVYSSISVPSVLGNTTFQSGLTSLNDITINTAGGSYLVFRDTTQGADAKNWYIQHTSGLLRVRAVNDGISNGNNAFTVSRNAESVRTIDVFGETWFESGISALASIATFSRISSSVTVVANDVWASTVSNSRETSRQISLVGSTSTLNVNQGRTISIRTLAASSITASAANTNVIADEMVFTVGGASGASFAIHSGGTVYIFNSAISAKAT